MILDILGGGGSGKTTLKLALLGLGATFRGFISYTTRPKRSKEEDRIHYHFVSIDAYLRNNSLVLKREADGWLYGVDQKDLEPRPDKRVLVTTFDVAGIRTLEEMGREVKVVYLNIPEEERERRMLLRGDDSETVYRRIAIDRQHLQSMEFSSPVLEIQGGCLNEIVEKVQMFISGQDSMNGG